uniref:Uncharacterized protein n=1 Tax=Pararge aegeria TaxID=116150 RepID=S4NXR1_9NEOP
MALLSKSVTDQSQYSAQPSVIDMQTILPISFRNDTDIRNIFKTNDIFCQQMALLTDHRPFTIHHLINLGCFVTNYSLNTVYCARPILIDVTLCRLADY